MRRTKIVATVGPSSWSEEGVARLAEAGVEVFRINTAHGTPEEHAELIRRVRKVAKGRAILLDTAGPKVRVVALPEPLEVKPGEQVLLGEGGIPLTHPEVLRAVLPGMRVLLADGTVELTVREVRGGWARCRVERGGVIKTGKGVNFPGAILPFPAITARDRQTLGLARAESVDFVALSFVQRPEDVAEARELLGADGPWVLAKVELAAAVSRVGEIVAAADGAMVARGDLGVELAPYQVPLAQKKLVDLCNAHAKPVIVATQMLQSMVSSPVPTRAEVADIANAVWDGADALMLSEETAVGKYPVEAVQAMNEAVLAAEGGDVPIRVPGLGAELVGEVPAAIAQSACTIAKLVRAKLILCATISGWTARLVASLRPPMPVVGVTPRPAICRRLHLVWGVTPLLVREASTVDELLELALEGARAGGLVSPKERLVFTAGLPFHQPGTTNLIRVLEA